MSTNHQVIISFIPLLLVFLLLMFDIGNIATVNGLLLDVQGWDRAVASFVISAFIELALIVIFIAIREILKRI